MGTGKLTGIDFLILVIGSGQEASSPQQRHVFWDILICQPVQIGNDSFDEGLHSLEEEP